MNQSDLTSLRKQLGLSSVRFWDAVKVTHPSGWRYENLEGYRIPEPVKELIRLRYELGIDLSKINKENAPLIRQILKSEQKILKSEQNQITQPKQNKIIHRGKQTIHRCR